MKVDLIINTTSHRNEIAVLEEDRLVFLTKEKKENKFIVGDFFLARVKRVMHGLNAVFIDVGYEKDAFLHYSDLGLGFKLIKKYLEGVRKNKNPEITLPSADDAIPKDGKIGDFLEAGQEVLVQVNKEPISSKGPRVGCSYSLAGRFLILVPFSNQIAISQKIKDRAESQRLLNLVKSIKPKNHGVICRTVAENQKVAELHADMNYLVERWEKMKVNITKAKELPVKVLHEINRHSSIIRDLFNSEFNHIYVNDQDNYDELKEYLKKIEPEKKNIVQRYEGMEPIFDYFGVTKQIKTLFGKKVMLPSGGYLIIEHTEAMHVVDVNSGNIGKKDKEVTQDKNAYNVNCEAAKEIALQLKLRDMGGIIVVDFIDMKSDEYNEKLFHILRENMKTDRARHGIIPPTRIGLVQITRQRVRPELTIKTAEVCPCCNGEREVPSTLMLIEEIKSSLQTQSPKDQSEVINIKAHPYVAAYLNKKTGFLRTFVKDLQKQIGCKLNVIESPSFSFLEYSIE